MEDITNLKDLMRLSGAQFVDGAYQAILKRSADESGMKHFLGKLRDGESKDFVILALARSSEAAAMHHRLPGLGTLMKQSRRSAVSRWLGFLSGATRVERAMNRIEFALAEQQQALEQQRTLFASQLGELRDAIASPRQAHSKDPVEVLFQRVERAMAEADGVQAMMAALTKAVRSSTVAGAFRHA